jgi:hypothetical protein
MASCLIVLVWLMLCATSSASLAMISVCILLHDEEESHDHT